MGIILSGGNIPDLGNPLFVNNFYAFSAKF